MESEVLLTEDMTNEKINASLLSVQSILTEVARRLEMVEAKVEKLGEVTGSSTELDLLPQPKETLAVNITGTANAAMTANEAIRAKMAYFDSDKHWINRRYFKAEDFTLEGDTLYITNNYDPEMDTEQGLD